MRTKYVAQKETNEKSHKPFRSHRIILLMVHKSDKLNSNRIGEEEAVYRPTITAVEEDYDANATLIFFFYKR